MGFCRYQWATRRDSQHNQQQGDQRLLVRGQNALTARVPNTFGQGMLQDQTQKITTGEAASPHFSTETVAAAKADLPTVASENVVCTQYAAVAGSAKLARHR